MQQQAKFVQGSQLSDEYFNPDLRLVVISDTHGNFYQLDLPKGDILIHAGDFTLEEESEKEAKSFLAWVNKQSHRHKIIVPGNHDYGFDRNLGKFLDDIKEVKLLIDNSVEASGLRFYGVPWTKVFSNMAFNLPEGPELEAKWSAIPEDTDILVTHGPAHGYLDIEDGNHLGEIGLRDRVEQVAPQLHVFGHIHSAAGVAFNDKTVFANCALVDQRLKLCRRPTVIDFRDGEIRAIGNFVDPNTRRLFRTWERSRD